MLLLIYAFTLWMGGYLLKRNGRKPGMRYAGLGLVAYAFGLLLIVLLPSFNLRVIVAIIPFLCWLQAIHHFRQYSLTQHQPHAPRQVFIAGSIFFAMSLTAALLPLEWLKTDLVMVLMGIDLTLLGGSIAALDAYDEGESLLPDALRSLVLVALGIAVFGGQVALIMAIEGASDGLRLLLYGIVTAVVALPIAAPIVQSILDGWLLTTKPQHERETLQAVYNALPRTDSTVDVLALDDAEFTRLTRRALSHLNDLERLASSPLLHLPGITQRLDIQGTADTTLERVMLLKALLTERIERLKPPNGNGFNAGDEWRYYNALYYPYVVGLKPYKVRGLQDGTMLKTEAQAAQQWFQAQVPERTLHNWQNKAAQLIAQDLRESKG